MPIIRARLRFHLEHQTPPAWSSEIVTHDECERHLRKLSRTTCGCMRYGTSLRRPKAIIYTASGLRTETNVARLFVTMSADQPLQGSDFACHKCDDPLCAHPDHLYVGTHHTNILDKFLPPWRIRLRMAARFFDYALMEVGDQPPLSTRKPRKPRQTPTAATTPIPLDMAEPRKGLHPSQMMVLPRKPFAALSAS